MAEPCLLYEAVTSCKTEGRVLRGGAQARAVVWRACLCTWPRVTRLSCLHYDVLVVRVLLADHPRDVRRMPREGESQQIKREGDVQEDVLDSSGPKLNAKRRLGMHSLVESRAAIAFGGQGIADIRAFGA
eukprot:1893587-Pleurochrysis_carterae.AAC.3